MNAKEIEQKAREIYPSDTDEISISAMGEFTGNEIRYIKRRGFIDGYTSAQQEAEKEMIEFAEWCGDNGWARTIPIQFKPVWFRYVDNERQEKRTTDLLHEFKNRNNGSTTPNN